MAAREGVAPAYQRLTVVFITIMIPSNLNGVSEEFCNLIGDFGRIVPSFSATLTLNGRCALEFHQIKRAYEAPPDITCRQLFYIIFSINQLQPREGNNISAISEKQDLNLQELYASAPQTRPNTRLWSIFRF